MCQNLTPLTASVSDGLERGPGPRAAQAHGRHTLGELSCRSGPLRSFSRGPSLGRSTHPTPPSAAKSSQRHFAHAWPLLTAYPAAGALRERRPASSRSGPTTRASTRTCSTRTQQPTVEEEVGCQTVRPGGGVAKWLALPGGRARARGFLRTRFPRLQARFAAAAKTWRAAPTFLTSRAIDVPSTSAPAQRDGIEVVDVQRRGSPRATHTLGGPRSVSFVSGGDYYLLVFMVRTASSNARSPSPQLHLPTAAARHPGRRCRRRGGSLRPRRQRRRGRRCRRPARRLRPLRRRRRGRPIRPCRRRLGTSTTTSGSGWAATECASVWLWTPPGSGLAHERGVARGRGVARRGGPARGSWAPSAFLYHILYGVGPDKARRAHGVHGVS